MVSRPEVNARRIVASGMSTGSTGSWWLAGLDDRSEAVLGLIPAWSITAARFGRRLNQASRRGSSRGPRRE